MEERTTTITLHEGKHFTGGMYYTCELCNWKGALQCYEPIIETFQYCPICGAKITDIQKAQRIGK